ncbi:MAG TPA: beta-propeller fold lactonase family protein [Vicinamibacteria bacterium]
MSLRIHPTAATLGLLLVSLSALPARGPAAAADAASPQAFAFVLSGGQVLAHEIEPTTGAFHRRGAVEAPECTRLGADPSGRWLLCGGPAGASVFRIGRNGSLQREGAGAGRAPWSAPPEIELDPSGRFVWGIGPEDGAPTVWAAALEAGGGRVRLVEREPAGWRPVDLQRAGRFLYVANQGSDDVWGYAVDAGSGALGALGRVAQLAAPRGLAADPEGRFVYVAARSIFAFRRADDGRLTPLGRVAPGEAVVVARPIEWAASCTPILSSWPSWPSARSRFPPTPPPPCASAAP